MIHSMTAYASATGTSPDANWQWEARSVNARGLDIRTRLPDGFDGLEQTIRTLLKSTFARGNITVSLRVSQEDASSALELDAAQLGRVLSALDQIQERAFEMGVTLGQPTAADVLQQRGVIQGARSETDRSASKDAAAADLPPLIAALGDMRRTEGEALHGILSGHLAEIEQLVTAASTAVESRRDQQRLALTDAMKRVLQDVGEVDPDRLAQELAALAVKQDVTEELDRLRAHISAAREMLASTGPVGRKLDFLAQEFNREANTLCAKSQYADLTAIGLDLKAVIDQMREQIQNVE